MEYARISAMNRCKIVWMLPVVVMLDVGLLLESVWQNVEVEEFQFNSYVTSTFQMTNIHDFHIHSHSETQIIMATHGKSQLR